MSDTILDCIYQEEASTYYVIGTVAQLFVVVLLCMMLDER